MFTADVFMAFRTYSRVRLGAYPRRVLLLQSDGGTGGGEEQSALHRAPSGCLEQVGNGEPEETSQIDLFSPF